MFEKHYFYFRVRFDGEKQYWYRSPSGGYFVGDKVIVPVSNNGLWKIGTVTEKIKCKRNEVPYPLNQTKGVAGKAGLFAEGKVKRHNRAIEESKYPPYDISVAAIKTKDGYREYITCRAERELVRNALRERGDKRLVIENYPTAGLHEIPPEAEKRVRDTKRKIAEEQRRISREIKRQKEEQLLREIEFEEEMEDLDQYN